MTMVVQGKEVSYGTSLINSLITSLITQKLKAYRRNRSENNTGFK